MSIESTYRQLVINDYITQSLQQGQAVTASDLEDQTEALVQGKDFTTPEFFSESYHVAEGEASSATKHRTTFLTIRQDLRVLYKEMLRLLNVNSNAFERWKVEAENLEKRLVDLEDRIENLLLLTQDTEGYHSVLIENFTDTSFTDQDLTTAEVDIKTATVEMTSSSSDPTRLFLNDLDPAVDTSFRVRTTVGFLSREDTPESTLADIFSQTSKTWFTNIRMTTHKEVTCELTVKLDPNGTVPLSKIFLELHHSAEASPIVVTPLYSVDNRTYNQVPSNTFSQEVRTSATFSFPEVQAQYLKILLTKVGPDPSGGEDVFAYQFGFKEIALFDEGFADDEVQQFFSSPLWVTGLDGNPKEIEKLTLEVCEKLETDTVIDYYVTTSNDATVPVDGSTLWTPISPINRAAQPHPIILDVGDTLEVDIGDTELETVDDEIVTISYAGRADSGKFVNPGRTFNLMSRNATSGALETTEIDSSGSGTVPRYTFVNSNDRILNYQIKDADTSSPDTALSLNDASFLIFRNVGKKGFDPRSVNRLVRGVQRGWRFEDPYYYCVVEIQNQEGMEIDVGDQPMQVDGVTYTGKIDNTILTGKSSEDTGLHLIRVHKNNWLEVSPYYSFGPDTPPTTVAQLKTMDRLYPYNHKLLIEGFPYDSTWTETEIQLYTGVDLFAENVMRRVSIFDIINNVASDNYELYAFDYDAPKTHEPSLDNEPTRVIVLKVDEENSDFRNERFVLRFSQINELRKYLRLRADLSTNDSRVSPVLYSYKMKLG